MFDSVGRRLALLNAVVVVLVIAVVGVGTVLLLRESLDREATHALKEQAEAAAAKWSPVFVGGKSPPQSSSGASSQRAEDTEGEDAEDVFKRGDTLLYAIGLDGSVLVNDRELNVDGLPASGGIDAALHGDSDTRIIRIDGEPARVYTEPVEEHGRVIGAVQAVRGEREHEQELRLVQTVALVGVGLGILVAVPAGLFLARRAMRPISATFQRQRSFVADASHELRTPLTLIRANVELAQRLPDTSPNTSSELGHILEEVDRMTRLVNDLLLLTRIGESDAKPPHLRVDLLTIVERTATSMRERARTLGVSLSLAGDESIYVRGDPDRILEATQAVVNNALTYTAAGGSVVVSAEHHGQSAVVRVTDTGIGITPSDQAHVFDRFFRADSARARSTGGTGLGLSITKAIIESHGGRIELQSIVGKGTEVRLILPVEHLPEREHRQRSAAVD